MPVGVLSYEPPNQRNVPILRSPARRPGARYCSGPVICMCRYLAPGPEEGCAVMRQGAEYPVALAWPDLAGGPGQSDFVRAVPAGQAPGGCCSRRIKLD